LRLCAIFIINQGGNIGFLTRREIEYAEKSGKSQAYLQAGTR
jgi:hypothetical protein